MRRHLDQPLGQFDGRIVALVREQVIVGQIAHLAHRRLDQPLLAEAERGAPQARHPLDIALARIVGDPDPLATLHDQGAALGMLHRVGVGMQQIAHILGRRRIAGRRRRALAGMIVAHRLVLSETPAGDGFVPSAAPA
jgi:hypothetical protein